MSITQGFAYLVTTNLADSDNQTAVDAAYYQHEDSFTVFKNEDGSLVASFANSHLVSIKRVDIEEKAQRDRRM